jgi:hypothetical protein
MVYMFRNIASFLFGLPRHIRTEAFMFLRFRAGRILKPTIDLAMKTEAIISYMTALEHGKAST